MIKKSLIILMMLCSIPLYAYQANTKGFLNFNAIHGYDPVAYFTEQKPVKGQSDFSYNWQNAEWLFSSTENRDAFIRNPEKYAPQYGGYCAYAMSFGKEVDIDPDAWSIVDNKLYLNYSKKIAKKWQQDRDSYIKQADEQWLSIVSADE